MTRRTWTAKRRLALLETHKGLCHICGGKIDGTREPWDIEHIIPLALGGDDNEGNCAPAHKVCHAPKTKQDARNLAKANRIRAKHYGARTASKNPIGGGLSKQFRRKIDGSVVPR